MNVNTHALMVSVLHTRVDRPMENKMLEIVYMRFETVEAGLRIDISYTSEPARRDKTMVQVMQSTLIP